MTCSAADASCVPVQPLWRPGADMAAARDSRYGCHDWPAWLRAVMSAGAAMTAQSELLLRNGVDFFSGLNDNCLNWNIAVWEPLVVVSLNRLDL